MDLGLGIEEEPFKKLINQGHIQGRSNFVYRLIDADGRGTNTFVSHGLIKQYKTSELHVDVNFVDNDVLDIDRFKQWREEYANAEFILENGKYVCGVEIEKMSTSISAAANMQPVTCCIAVSGISFWWIWV